MCSRNRLLMKHLDCEDKCAIETLVSAGRIGVIDSFDNTPLHIAATKGLSEIVSILLSYGPDVTARNIHGDTAFTSALKRGHLDVCKMLLNAGSEMEYIASEGLTPLMCAVRYNHTDIVNFLLDNNLCVNQTNKGGQTALFEACREGRAGLADVLLKAGALHDVLDMHGQTPLLLAVRKGYTECVKVLVQHGTDPCQKAKALHGRRWVTMTPMYAALLSGILDVVKVMWAAMACTECELSRYSQDGELQQCFEEQKMGVKEWLSEKILSPRPLVSLCHRVISLAVGYRSGRLKRLKSLGLPNVIQNKLMLQDII